VHELRVPSEKIYFRIIFNYFANLIMIKETNFLFNTSPLASLGGNINQIKSTLFTNIYIDSRIN